MPIRHLLDCGHEPLLIGLIDIRIHLEGNGDGSAVPSTCVPRII